MVERVSDVDSLSSFRLYSTQQVRWQCLVYNKKERGLFSMLLTVFVLAKATLGILQTPAGPRCGQTNLPSLTHVRFY